MLGTYPEQVMFAKGHGTQNDFVVLPDLDAALTLTPAVVSALCDRRRGLGADGVLRVTTAGAALAAGVLDRVPDGVNRRRLVHGLPQRRRVDRADVRQRRAGVRALPAGQRPGNPRRVRRRITGRPAARRLASRRCDQRRRQRRHGQGQPAGARTGCRRRPDLQRVGGRRRQPAPGLRRPCADGRGAGGVWTSRRR